MTETIYLALGSNVGERAQNLKNAIRALRPAVKVLEESAIYETPPWGYEEQGAFLNMAIKGETDLKPLDLLAHLKEIEAKIGRTTTFKNGPREIDLDILFYGRRPFRHKNLIIPHPRLHERAFVLAPLADIAFDLQHPTLKATIHELLLGLDTREMRMIKVFKGG